LDDGFRRSIPSACAFAAVAYSPIASHAAKHTLPAMYPWRKYVSTGGLMCYGPSLFDACRLVGVYAGKIFKEAKQADPIDLAA
jgi:hypothetical protein